MMRGDRADKSPLEDEPFLSRWSKRKLEQEQLQTEASREVEPAEAESKKALSELTDADMPPLESLDEEADYSGFLSPKVSEALRQQALQRLFRSACFNVCDGLDDYAEDFTRFDKLGDLITAEWRSRLEQEAKRAAEQAKAALGETETPPHQGQPGAERARSDHNSAEALQAARDQEHPLMDKKDQESSAT
jgi:hypothetical protein